MAEESAGGLLPCNGTSGKVLSSQPMSHDYGIFPRLDKAVILGAAMCPAGLGDSTKVPALLFCAQCPATSKGRKCLVC